MAKPLFIPLKTEWFEAFERGEKEHELRRYGPRWSSTACRVGRPVTLSHGYGKQRRLYGRISSFAVVHASRLWPDDQDAVERTYGTLDINVAVIGIGDLCPSPTESESVKDD